MSKVDITPLLPPVEAEIERLLAPPFKVYEVFTCFGAVGKLLEDAEELVTVEDYEDAWKQLTEHLEAKYDLFRKLDDMIPAGLLEPFDGPALRLAWGMVGKSLAKIAADKIG